MLQGRRFQDLLKIVTANSEENVDDYLELLRPDDYTRSKMGANFESTIGYNPIEYYDIKQLNKMIESILDDKRQPGWVKDKLSVEANKKAAVDRAYEIFSACRDDMFLTTCMEQALEELYSINVGLSAVHHGDMIKALGAVGEIDQQEEDEEELEEEEDEDNFSEDDEEERFDDDE